MPARVIMLVDLDYFFAQCEELRNPSLKDKPVVVCVYSGRSEDSGAVSTANYIARKYGVRSGMSISLARKKLERSDAVFLPVDDKFYEETSDKIMRILRGYAESFEQAGIDEAYLDVSRKLGGDFAKAEELGQSIKKDVKAQQRATCSIGVGPNKLVAKIAADSQKPDGLTIVRPEEVQGFLFPLPASRLVGVGKKTEQKMQVLGIRTIGDLANYDAQLLVETFGKSLGVYFRRASMGMDDDPVQEAGETESISRISTLREDTRNLEAILDRVNQLCDQIHTELVQRRLSCKQVGIIAITRDMRLHSRSRTFENPTNDLHHLEKSVNELYRKFLTECNLEVRRAGVKVSNLVREQEKQKQLTTFISNPKS